MNHSTLGVSDFQYQQAFHKWIPPRLLQQAVARNSPVQRRQRSLPAHLVLASVVAWFFSTADRLPAISAWLCHRPDDLPSDPAIYQTRDRLGWAPMRWLRKQVIAPLAQPALDPSAFYHGLRILAIDGTTFTVADTKDNDKTFGRANNHKGTSGYPLIRMVALCEVGTHALLDWVARGFGVSEQSLAARLWHDVPPGSLLLADRNFHCYPLWEAARDGSWDLLVRVQSGPKFPIDQVLGDGSFLSWGYPRRGKYKKSRGIRVRVITYTYTDAEGKEQTSRLLTSLLDAARHPASELVELYHQRWEQEGVFKEIKSALSQRVTHLRSHKPQRVMQELEGLLLGHFVIRHVILEVAREKKIRPIEISFTGTLRVLRTRLAGAPKGRRKKGSKRANWWTKTKEAISRELLQKRRQRRCPRKKKVTRSAWPAKRKRDKEQPVPHFKILPPKLS